MECLIHSVKTRRAVILKAGIIIALDGAEIVNAQVFKPLSFGREKHLDGCANSAFVYRRVVRFLVWTTIRCL